MSSNIPDLLYITNPDNTDPEEDRFLSQELSDTFDVTLATPRTAVELLPQFSRCLIRNAWPGRLFVKEFEAIQEVSEKHCMKMYHPVHRGYLEDKLYILDLWKEGYPVIPSVLSVEELDILPHSTRYIIKPNQGSGSSFGVESLSREELKQRSVKDYLIQPDLDFQDEISFYFIDDEFQHAMVSEGKGKRWYLKEHHATSDQIRWARRFVEWNNLPYGIQRIDACRMPSGELFLMEVENHLIFLSLLDLPEETRTAFCKNLKMSLLKHLL